MLPWNAGRRAGRAWGALALTGVALFVAVQALAGAGCMPPFGP